MKGAISWFANNHVAANLLMLFLILAGLIMGITMKVEVFPETALDMIAVVVEYPGASPAEVEEGVIRRVEENVAGLAGIKRIDSKAREGYATVLIEVIKDWDLKTLLDEVKAEVDRITTFPKEAEKPIVREVTQRHQVINIALYGDAPESTLKHMAEKIKDEITDLPGISIAERYGITNPLLRKLAELLPTEGITLAELFGVRESEIHIEIPEKTLRQYGLTLGKVAEAVRAASLDLPA
ncbi:MAG: efflux RND transporter permease subunit, partial [Deltaproteobacteria bacterium]|nr:efflux RND transporter permease subunit [Deltaproteobacteria bacterium]